MSLRKIIGEKLFGDTVHKTVDDIESFLESGNTIIDLGAGTCLFTKLLRERGFKVQPVDIKNRSYFSDISSQVYNGKNLPFKNNDFDVCLLIAVLHHTPDPAVVLAEAVRVSRKLIVYEDAVTNLAQRFYTYFIDSVLNKEFFGHPHTNKTDADWKELFATLGLKLVRTDYKKSWLFLYNPVYFLEKTQP